jgi:predicted transcriptional regulator
MSDISFKTGLTAGIVAAFVARNQVAFEQVEELIRAVHRTLGELEGQGPGGGGHAAGIPRPPPCEMPAEGQTRSPDDDAASGFVRNGVRSVYPDHLLCLDDGKPVVFLSRHLRSLGSNMDAYRERWNLPADYPTVASAYASEKRRIALSVGFGRIGGIRPLRRDVASIRKRPRIPGTLGLAVPADGLRNAAPSGLE